MPSQSLTPMAQLLDAPFQGVTVVKALAAQRLVALFAVFGLLLNFPLLALWDSDALLLGVPFFPLALFMLWALLIGVLAWLMERGPASDAPELP